MHFQGIIVGLFSFFIIGIFHPIVIKSEYHFSDKIWPAFFMAGILFMGMSVFVSQLMASSLLSITGFACLWSIKEIKEQKKRVEKGWFPQKKKEDDKAL